MRSRGPTVGPGGARARARGGPGLGQGARAGARGGHGPPGPPLATGLVRINTTSRAPGLDFINTRVALHSLV